MTFDLLPDDSSSYTTYSEDGLTLGGVGVVAGSPHFHAVPDGSGGTAAEIFNSDGFLQELVNGGTFSLESVDFLDFSAGISALVTTDLGGNVVLNTPGTYVFPDAFFNQISWVRFSIQGATDDESYIIDNLTTSVPEPSTYAAIVAVAAMCGWRLRCRRAA